MVGDARRWDLNRRLAKDFAGRIDRQVTGDLGLDQVRQGVVVGFRPVLDLHVCLSEKSIVAGD